MAQSSQHYGPLSYHTLGRVYPRSRLRAPWGVRVLRLSPVLIPDTEPVIPVHGAWYLEFGRIYSPSIIGRATIPGPGIATISVPGTAVARISK